MREEETGGLQERREGEEGKEVERGRREGGSLGGGRKEGGGREEAGREEEEEEVEEGGGGGRNVGGDRGTQTLDFLIWVPAPDFSRHIWSISAAKAEYVVCARERASDSGGDDVTA